MATFYSNYDGREYRLRLVVTQVSQSIDNNTSNISYALYLENGAWRFANYNSTGSLVINGSTQWSLSSNYSCAGVLNSEKLIKSGTMTIAHNSDGTKTLAFSASFKTNVSGSFGTTTTLTISSSMSLTTIPRASDPTVNYSSRALGSVLRVTTNRASTSFTHTLQWKAGSGGYATFATSVGAYYDWTLPNEIANYIANSTSGTVTIRCYTYSGVTHIGTEYVTFTATIPNNSTFKPDATLYSPNVIDGLGTYFVQGKSKVRITSGGVAKWGATLAQFRVTIDGSNYYGSDITSAILNTSGSKTITLRVTDSRGYYSEDTSVITVQPYYSPKINSFSASRNPAQTGIDLSVSINFDIAPVANQNAKYHSVEYREVGTSIWNTVASSTLDYTLSIVYSEIGVLEANKSYEVKLELRDSYNTSSNPITITRTISTVFKLMNANPSGRGLAIGKVSESDIFDVVLPTMLPHEVNLRGSSSGIQNLSSLQFLESDRSTRQGWIGFGSSSTDILHIANDFGSRITMNKDLYINDNLAWHEGSVVSGSNPNGSYIRFPNGIQICYNGALPSSNNDTTGKLVTFPANFYDNAYNVNASVRGVVSGGIGGSYVVEINPVGAVSCYIKILVHTPTIIAAAVAGTNFGYIAIGRWK